MTNVALNCHPAFPSPQDQQLSVELSRQGPLLSLEYRLSGDIASVLLPEPKTATREDNLWQHSCFELFLQKPGDDGYEEYNFSPSGCWAHYRFSGYRQALPEPEANTPPIRCALEHGQFRLSTCVELLNDQPLNIGLSSILEDQQGKLSYWAAFHPRQKPDFHDSAGFVVSLK